MRIKMSKILKVFAAFSSTLLLAGCVATDGSSSLPRGGGQFTARPPEGGWTRFGPFSTLNKNCEVTSVAKVRVIEQPRNGMVRLITASGGPGYSADSAFAHCNSQRIAGPFLEYHPRSGYRGVDQFRFEVRFKDGERRVFSPTLNVGSN
jgi:hypothetical protein